MSEEHPLQAQSPYSASKIAADSIAYSYCTSFGLPLTIARPFNTFGPRQSRRAIIPTIISQFLSGMDEIHVGEIQSTRDLTFVTDTCRGLIDLYKKSYFNGEIYNIGSNSEYSISQIIEEVSKYFKRNLPIVQKNERMRPKKSEVMRLVCDYSKINSLSGFTPQVTLQRGISETCQWMSQSHINAALQQNSYGI
jgi:nucleoside-diphosphate-sugar epimerase